MKSIILEQGLGIGVVQLLKDHFINYVKYPPSATGIHQACDRASTFKKLKNEMKLITMNSVLYEKKLINRVLEEQLVRYLTR